jgi:hypothetical protein
MEIDGELEKLTIYFNKKIKKQRFFKSARTIKDKSGNNRYTFFIGSPGLVTAIAITILLFLALYISTSINNIYIWFIYLFFCIIVLPFSLKVDRINQIRLLSMKLVCEAYVLLKKSNPSEIDIQNAKDLLIKSSKFVDEPAVVRQIQIIDTYLNNKKPL